MCGLCVLDLNTIILTIHRKTVRIPASQIFKCRSQVSPSNRNSVSNPVTAVETGNTHRQTLAGFFQISSVAGPHHVLRNRVLSIACSVLDRPDLLAEKCTQTRATSLDSTTVQAPAFSLVTGPPANCLIYGYSITRILWRPRVDKYEQNERQIDFRFTL